MTVLEVTRERGRLGLRPADSLTFVKALGLALHVPTGDIEEILSESQLGQIEEFVSKGIADGCKNHGPFDLAHNGDFALARSIYVICRLRSPNAVLETGVAYGVTSAFALQSLAVNQKGALFSVDLPPLGKEADEHVGKLIPQQLRARWHLNRGTVKRVLPGLLHSIGELDLFVHDSLHTSRNMMFEFETVWPSLTAGGMLIADDIGLNNAFSEFAAHVRPAFAAVIREENKGSLFGIMVKPS